MAVEAGTECYGISQLVDSNNRKSKIPSAAKVDDGRIVQLYHTITFLSACANHQPPLFTQSALSQHGITTSQRILPAFERRHGIIGKIQWQHCQLDGPLCQWRHRRTARFLSVLGWWNPFTVGRTRRLSQHGCYGRSGCGSCGTSHEGKRSCGTS
jgi:hypothetical protein